MTSIAAWQNFYVIVGSSAAALTGLQFVTMALIADLPMGGSASGIDAFATPTIVHFGTVLLLSAVLRVPWPSIFFAAAMREGAGPLAQRLVRFPSTKTACTVFPFEWTLTDPSNLPRTMLPKYRA